jgi:hypothetical protein
MQLKSVSISKMLSEVVTLQTRGMSGIHIRVPVMLWFTSLVRLSALAFDVAEASWDTKTWFCMPVSDTARSTRDRCVTLMIQHCSLSRGGT